MTREELIELAAAAWRPDRPGGGVGTHSAWHDLDDEGRQEAWRRARQDRLIEAALDPEGLSSTARAVLARIARAR